MLKKIKLFHQIKKFYKLFGEELGSDFIHHLADLTTDNLSDVLFDINEMLTANTYCWNAEAYTLDAWLNKLRIQVENFRKSKTKQYKGFWSFAPIWTTHIVEASNENEAVAKLTAWALEHEGCVDNPLDFEVKEV